MHIIQLFLKTTIIWKKNTGMFKSFLLLLFCKLLLNRLSMEWLVRFQQLKDEELYCNELYCGHFFLLFTYQWSAQVALSRNSWLNVCVLLFIVFLFFPLLYQMVSNYYSYLAVLTLPGFCSLKWDISWRNTNKFISVSEMHWFILSL